MKPPTDTSTTMILPKRLLDAAGSVSPDAKQGAFIDAENRTVVVTNGRCVVITPIPGDAPVKEGYISPALLKIAKARNPKSLVLDYSAGTLNGESTAYPEDLGPFPQWRQVIPHDAPTYRITLDPDLIAAIAGSIGHDSIGFTFEFGPSGLEPATIRMGNATAIIMPMRSGDDSGYLGPVGDSSEEIATLKAQVKSLSERSDSTPDATSPADAALIDSLTSELHQLRARVRQLEASPAAVKPLDKKPAKSPKAEKAPVPFASAPPVLSRNAERNGIELRFNGKPDDATRAGLKANGFRWLPGQTGQPWAARYSEEALVFATSLAEGAPAAPLVPIRVMNPSPPTPPNAGPGIIPLF